jgi:glycosyltransferase involved in cell wall biosynthesis
MIASRNRCDDLRRTLAHLHGMNPPPGEIFVVADACTDGTVAMVREDFPHCRLHVNASNQGSIRSRDFILRHATGDLVLCLDDDSYPLQPDFFARLPEVFAAHPEAAVISFPELRDGNVFVPPDKTPETPGHYLSAYANGAAAMRRADYLASSGYPPFFQHAYEEPDYALQCYARGRAVWFEPSLVLRHHFSGVNRDRGRTHRLNARNELWSVWMRCPWPWLPAVSLYRLIRQFAHACSEGADWALREPEWWRQATVGLDPCLVHRRPIPWRIYFAWMRLARSPLSTRMELERFFGTTFQDS